MKKSKLRELKAKRFQEMLKASKEEVIKEVKKPRKVKEDK